MGLGVRLLLLCIAISLLAGCSSAPKDPGVPEGADLLTEIVSPSGERSDRFTSLQVPEDGALYVVNATRKQLVLSNPVKAGDVIKLSWGGVNLVGRLPSKSTYKPAYERQVARYDVGHMYRVYYKPGETVNAKTDEGSPLTRPFDTQDRTVNPIEQKRP